MPIAAQGQYGFPHVAGRKVAEIIAEASRATAVVGRRNDRCDLVRMTLQPRERRLRPGAPTNHYDLRLRLW
jgi:hypothetical protein